jgi:hypothetical protein
MMLRHISAMADLNFTFSLIKGIVKGKKVKESRKKPGVAQRVPGGVSFQISMTFGK